MSGAISPLSCASSPKPTSSNSICTHGHFCPCTDCSSTTQVDMASTPPTSQKDPSNPIPQGRPPSTRSPNAKLTDRIRQSICQYHMDNPNILHHDIAKQFKVHRSTISKLLKQKEDYLGLGENYLGRNGERAKHRPIRFPEIDETMTDFLEHWSSQRIPITDKLIRNQALAIAKRYNIDTEEDFKASYAWIQRFKRRNRIRGKMWEEAEEYLAVVSEIATVGGKTFTINKDH